MTFYGYLVIMNDNNKHNNNNNNNKSKNTEKYLKTISNLIIYLKLVEDTG